MVKELGEASSHLLPMAPLAVSNQKYTSINIESLAIVKLKNRVIASTSVECSVIMTVHIH